MEYSAPQIAGRDEPFRSAIREHLKGHTQGLEDLAVEMLARGLSVRDIEDAFKDESGRLLLSKSAVSQLGERLWEDYQAIAQRDLRQRRRSARSHSCWDRRSKGRHASRSGKLVARIHNRILGPSRMRVPDKGPVASASHSCGHLRAATSSRREVDGRPNTS